MVKSKYSFEKRQKEIAKKKRKEEKRLKKMTKSAEKDQTLLMDDKNTSI